MSAAGPATQDGASAFWRFVVVTLLVLCGLGFGLASLCGAAFTVAGLADDSPYAGAALVVGIPSLLVGGVLCWLCVRALRKRIRPKAPAAQ
jgi:ABC-type thiamin/hydroxymethylpyrimidine transport system permease subunit